MNYLIPTFICVVMPISIVLIISYKKINADNKRAEILKKAFEANNMCDVDKLADAFKTSTKSAAEVLNLRLLRGCMFTFGGVGAVAYGIYADAVGFGLTARMVFLAACALLAVGISYLVVYFVTRSDVSDDKSNR